LQKTRGELNKSLPKIAFSHKLNHAFNQFLKEGMFMKKNVNLLKFVFSPLVLAILISGCAKQKKKEDMAFNDLKSRATAYMDKKRYDDAAEYFEQIVSQHPDHPDIAAYKLVLAGLYFKLGKYPAAYEMYEHFNQFYPASSKAEYAKYRAVLAKYYQTLKMDCDQTETEEATRLCQEYLNNTDYRKYRTDVVDIQKTCEHKLVDKEVYVFNFYLRQGKYDAAEKRLETLRKTYLASNNALDARLLYLESKLAKKQKNKTLLTKNIEKLATKYPESQFTLMAQSLVSSKNNFIF